ncbi:hypothetical protein ABW21_db0205346 [Orbilia brochopaga]|nr:hypothetical protein ABW21_db0205346 [Drechslerella brochopaga]
MRKANMSSDDSRSNWIRSIVESVHKENETKSQVPLLHTPLGAAVAALDATLVQQRLADNDVNILDYGDNTFLHLIADPQLNDDAASRVASWDELLQATKEVVHLLVESGLSTEAVNKEGSTPLLSTISRFKGAYYKHVYPNGEPGSNKYGEGHVIIALLEAGANVDKWVHVWGDTWDRDPIWEEQPQDPDSEEEKVPNPLSTLDLWMRADPSTIRHPEKFEEVMRTLYSKVLNPNARREGKTILYRLVESGMSVDRICHTIRTLLDSENPRPLNIDSLDDTGKTPFIHALRTVRANTASEMIALADFFLELGARPEIISTKRATAITSVYLNGFLGPGSRREVIEHLLKATSSSDDFPGHSKLVAVTPAWVLASAFYTGDVAIAKMLLKAGMKHRLHEIVKFPANPLRQCSRVPSWRALEVLSRQSPKMTVYDVAFYQLTMESKIWSNYLYRYDDRLKSPSYSDRSFDEGDDSGDEATDNETWSCKSSTHGNCNCNERVDKGNEDNNDDENGDAEWETDDEGDESDSQYIPLTSKHLTAGGTDEIEQGNDSIDSHDDSIDEDHGGDDTGGEGDGAENDYISFKKIIKFITTADDNGTPLGEKKIRVDEGFGAINFTTGILFGVHRDFGPSFCSHHKISNDDLGLVLRRDVVRVPTELVGQLKKSWQDLSCEPGFRSLGRRSAKLVRQRGLYHLRPQPQSFPVISEVDQFFPLF